MDQLLLKATEEILRIVAREGVKEGCARTLLHILRRRFGTLPRRVTSRVKAASQEDLDRWTERVIEGESLSAVLDG
jgi:hypothetical protein